MIDVTVAAFDEMEPIYDGLARRAPADDNSAHPPWAPAAKPGPRPGTYRLRNSRTGDRQTGNR